MNLEQQLHEHGLFLRGATSLTPQEIENLLKSNALPRNSAQCPEPCGTGLLNADIAVGGPVQPLRLSVSPTRFELDEGETAILTVMLTQGGTPAAGETVRFSSNDVNIATIAPNTATTDAAGQVQATVTSVSRGISKLVVSIPGQTQTTPVNVVIRVVPSIGLIAILLLAILIGVIGFRRLGASAGR